MKKTMIGTMMLSLLALGFAGTAWAEEKYETPVEYNVGSTYSIVIPPSVNLNESSEIEVGTVRYNIAPAEKLTITLDTDNEYINEDGAIKLTRQKDPSKHTITTKLTKKNEQDVLKKGSLLFKATGTSDSKNVETFEFADVAGNSKAGNYTTTINFVADVGPGM